MTREVIVTTRRRLELDEDRMEEWLDANHGGGHTKIEDVHTADVLAERGEFVDWECPRCGQPATGIRQCGEVFKYSHPSADDFDVCEVRRTTDD